MDNSSDIEDRLLEAILNNEIEEASADQQAHSTTLLENNEIIESSTEQQSYGTTSPGNNEVEENLTEQQAQSTTTAENLQDNMLAIIGTKVRLPLYQDHSTNL